LVRIDRGRSKKQSAGSRGCPLSLPEDFVLYLDENLHNCKPILDGANFPFSHFGP